MKYEEIKEHHESGQLSFHYFEDENGDECGEYRSYYEDGKLHWHNFYRRDREYGGIMMFDDDGTLCHYYLMDGKGKEIATVVASGKRSTHSEEQLIEIAKEHGLPLLSDLPKTDAELTHWNLKYPDLPCLPIESE